MGYQEIRAALGRGFSVSTLNEVTRLGHALLASDTALGHPIAAYVLSATAQKIANHLDQQTTDDAISVVESHIRPKMLAVLDSADGPPGTLLHALDELARGYSEAMAFLT